MQEITFCQAFPLKPHILNYLSIMFVFSYLSAIDLHCMYSNRKNACFQHILISAGNCVFCSAELLIIKKIMGTHYVTSCTPADVIPPLALHPSHLPIPHILLYNI